MSQIGWFFSFVISRPLGWILYWCYFITRNYGLAILLFTLVTRVLLFPLAIKQQKSTAEMTRLQPKLQAIQKKYAKDKQKLQEEQMKLYQEEGYNPFGGCLPLLIQMPILWGLYNVIYKPFTYILGLNQTTIRSLVDRLKDPIIALAGGQLGKNPTVSSIVANSRSEIYIAGAMKNHMDLITGIIPAHTLKLDFNFAWLDLTVIPGYKISSYLLIPIVCYLTSLASSWFSMKITQASMPQQNQASTKSMNMSMIVIMPLVSAWFAFSVPAGVGFYWICTNLFMVIQVLILNAFYNPKKLAEKAELESERRKAEKRKRLGIVEKKEEEAPYQPTEQETAQPSQVQKPKPVRSNGKKTKKQLLEENRRRLAESRAKEKDNR